ncbi:ABC transporter permease [Pseudonocardia sp. WMMC193]|uniref:ABC transporter permease n=1 Tax=Pseudonocardia sp. WMMC193 TaxID=2911965 RepID=UPI001F31CEE9|nr:ABC transporter permease [Pseudonocardia sp. WMMC193]MCF7548611.1 ABC transporter permease [Pseudonocardia sp. WMMC193]
MNRSSTTLSAPAPRRLPREPRTRPVVGPLVRTLGPFAVLVLLVALVTIAEPAFVSGHSMLVVANQAVPILLLGLGQMFVVLTGGIDLSSAALASLGTVLVALLLPGLGPLAVIVTLGALTAAGMLSGILAAYGQVPSFVVTLGALGFWGAVALVLSGASTIYVDENFSALSWLTDLGVGAVSSSVVLSVALVAEIGLALRYLPRGRVFHQVGLGERAALMAGVRARRVRVGAFALSGLFAGLAGLVLTAQQQSAAAQLGDSLLLPAIAAAVVGGCAITGGIGGPWRVLVGALIVTVLRVGGAVAGIDPDYQQIVYGVVVIVAVAATLDRSRLTVVK